MTILYPVADTAEAALHAPAGFAAREREAVLLARTPVGFVTEAVGPAFSTEAEALAAYAGRSADEAWRQLRPVSAQPGAKPALRAPVKPSYRGGRRWPTPDPSTKPATLWRLSISYWRTAAAEIEQIAVPARKLRRDGAGRALDGDALGALARQPLRPALPQRPLDIGLFEIRLPEDPDLIMPDE